MIKPHILSRSIALALAGLAHAADAVQERIEVVAKPIVEDNRIDDYAASSAVIGERQLRDLGAVDLASALRRAPGVQISRYNPVGAFGGDQGGAVFVRGLGLSRPGSEIKTYIDGVPFYMGLWNHPLLDLLPINGMRSVTVYKSPSRPSAATTSRPSTCAPSVRSKTACMAPCGCRRVPSTPWWNRPSCRASTATSISRWRRATPAPTATAAMPTAS
ncbi:TonB-dependent receptor [Chitinimonas koreensis]|uniref:TonB-dependent receptor n=1 Tax=Chitinimonas koreensis TaxID=356302 RepID=UPI00223EF369|nr:Plug domain-containing protein [Chitinimonas koreensis]